MIVALFITLLLAPFEQTLVDCSFHNWSLKFLQKSIFWPFSFKIQENHISSGNSAIAIVKYIINQFLLKNCQKKRYEQDYNILSEIVTKYLPFRRTAHRLVICDVYAHLGTFQKQHKNQNIF